MVYGAVMAVYTLARPLSLPPVLTNLFLPIAVLAAMWFAVARQMKYFQRRAAQREVPLPFTTGFFRSRYTEEQRREYWCNARAKGKKRFIWRRGILLGGLPMFAIFTPLILYDAPTQRVSLSEAVPWIIFSLFVWMIGGYLYGRFVWKIMESRYGD